MEKEYITDFCELRIFKKYAVTKFFENKILNEKSGSHIRKLLSEHFKDENFVLISDRTHQFEIDFNLYKNRKLWNMKGLAVVSSNLSERERALKEVELFDESFAYFENMEDAHRWAEDFFM